jgi:hypothetical protein
LTAAGTSAATAGSAAGVEVDDGVDEDVDDPDGGVTPAFVAVDDELLLPHPASAKTPTNETHIFQVRITGPPDAFRDAQHMEETDCMPDL